MNQLTNLDAGFDLSGRTALVTGAGSGLGRHFARVLARAGATVALCARRAGKLEETAAIIGQEGGKSVCVTLDVTDPRNICGAVDTVVSLAGLPRILINNAGTNRPKFVTDTTVDDWDVVLDTNLRGCFLMAKEIGTRLIGGEFAGKHRQCCLHSCFPHPEVGVRLYGGEGGAAAVEQVAGVGVGPVRNTGEHSGSGLFRHRDHGGVS